MNTKAETAKSARPARNLLRACLGFCAVSAVFILVYQHFGNGFYAVVSACVLALLAGILPFIWPRSGKGFGAGAIIGAVALILFMLFTLKSAEGLDGKSGTFSVRADDAVTTEYGSGVLEGTLISVNGKACRKLKVHLILADASPEYIAPGDRVVVSGSLAMTKSLSRFSSGTFLNLYQNGDFRILSLGADNLICKLRRFSLNLSASVEKLLPGDAGALLRALLCGDKSGFDSGFNVRLRYSGLAHIAAVSGMHVSIIMALVCLFLGKRLGSAVSLPLMIAFAAMTGFSPSIMRAVIMGAFISAAFLMRRDYDSFTALFTAAAVLIAANPFVLLSASFLLSFSSTLGIILLGTPMMIHLPSKLPKVILRNGILNKIFKSLLSAFAITLTATVFSLPIQLAVFSSVSLVSLISNLLAIWAVTVAMFFGVIFIPLAMLIPPLQGVFVFICSLPLKYLVWVINLMGDRFALSAQSDNLFLMLTSAGLIALALLMHFKKISGKICGVFSVFLVTLCIICSLLSPMPTLYIWGTDGSFSAVASVGREVFAVNAPVSYEGSYFVSNAAASRKVGDLILTSSHYSLSGGAEELNADKVYSPAPVHGIDPLVYESDGFLKSGGFYIELFPCGNENAAVRISNERFSLADLTAVSPYDPLPQLVKTDFLIIDPDFASSPNILRAICAQAKPSVVYLSGKASVSLAYLRDTCCCTVLQLDEMGTVKIY